MPRVKRGVVAHRRHKKVLKLARGYRGAKSRWYRLASQQLLKSYSYAYAHRKDRKNDFRKLWIARINAAARLNGLSYSRLMFGLRQAGIEINRKMLADLAVNDLPAFGKLVDVAKENLGAR
ncbi:MAG: 50S ribosomal protein L20 [Syntrophomonadaceae bacterium]|nr:50S ribosomal protein L20 [Syntrophomonadaceae bacterium]